MSLMLQEILEQPEVLEKTIQRRKRKIRKTQKFLSEQRN